MSLQQPNILNNHKISNIERGGEMRLIREWGEMENNAT